MPKKLQLLVPLVGPEGPQGPRGETGSAGKDGATFTPSVSEDGILSWTNDKGLANPPSVPIGKSGNSGIHVGPEEPTDPNVVVWVDTDDEETPGDSVVDPEAIKQLVNEYMDERTNALIDTALAKVPNAAEVAY